MDVHIENEKQPTRSAYATSETSIAMPILPISSSTDLISLSEDERLDSLSLFANGGSLNGLKAALVGLL